MQWYRRIENRVAPVVAFSGLIIENTSRWAFEQRNQHYYTTYYRAKEFLTNPCKNIVGFLRAREIEALSSLRDLSWGSPTYSNPRKVYPLIRSDVSPSEGTTARREAPIPVTPKNTPTE